MFRFHGCRFLLAVACVVVNLGANGLRAVADDRPNVLFVFADDQCFDTINALGNREVRTPNLDRLARRGTTFTHAYNMGSWSGAVCVASRTMLNSGRFIWNANAIYATSEQERAAGRWWSEYMKAAGYRTYMTGKWHCRPMPRSHLTGSGMFDRGCPSKPKRATTGRRPTAATPGLHRIRSSVVFGREERIGARWSPTTRTSFSARRVGLQQPFFMYLAFNAPHDPRQSPAEYVQQYPVDAIELPVNFQPQYPFAELIGCGPKLRDERLAPFPRTPFAVKVHRQEYYAIITHMDAMVGRILDALERSGKAENTWIFFTADHGLAVGQHGLMGKQNLYDHSVRVPFFGRGPGR